MIIRSGRVKEIIEERFDQLFSNWENLSLNDNFDLSVFSEDEFKIIKEKIMLTVIYSVSFGEVRKIHESIILERFRSHFKLMSDEFFEKIELSYKSFAPKIRTLIRYTVESILSEKIFDLNLLVFPDKWENI